MYYNGILNLLKDIMVIRKSCHDINNEFNGFSNTPLKMFDQECMIYNGYMLSSVTFAILRSDPFKWK